jgi:hypothetical protein
MWCVIRGATNVLNMTHRIGVLGLLCKVIYRTPYVQNPFVCCDVVSTTKFVRCP